MRGILWLYKRNIVLFHPTAKKSFTASLLFVKKSWNATVEVSIRSYLVFQAYVSRTIAVSVKPVYHCHDPDITPWSHGSFATDHFKQNTEHGGSTKQIAHFRHATQQSKYQQTITRLKTKGQSSFLSWHKSTDPWLLCCSLLQIRNRIQSSFINQIRSQWHATVRRFFFRRIPLKLIYAQSQLIVFKYHSKYRPL